MNKYNIPANTRRCFDAVSTSFDRYGRQMDVETTLCALLGINTILVDRMLKIISTERERKRRTTIRSSIYLPTTILLVSPFTQASTQSYRNTNHPRAT